MPDQPFLTRVQTALRAFRDPTAAQRGWVSHPTFPPFNILGDSYPGNGQPFIDDNSSYARAYIAVSDVRTCIDTYAWAGGEVPTRIVRNSTYDRENDQVVATSEDVKPRHIWYEAVKWHQSRLNIGLIQAMVYNAMLMDTIYVLKLKSQFNSSPRLQVLNSQGMQVEDHTGYVTQYRYSAPGQYKNYQPNEIAYNHGFNPFYDTRGASLVASIVQKINIDENLDTFLQAFFINDAMPGMTVAPTEGNGLTPEQNDQLKQLLRDYHKGVGNRRRALVSTIPVDFNVLQEPDIEKHTKVKEPISLAIFRAFGVPMVLVGDNSSTSYQNAPNVLNNFVKLKVKPILTDIQTYINMQCLPFLDGSQDVRFKFDFESLDVPTEADKIKSDIANANYAGGLWTLNEARVHTGQSEYKNGDVLASGVTVEQLNTPAALAPVQPQTPATLPEPGTATALLPETTDRDTETGRSITIMLGLAQDTNLMLLQNQVKEFCREYTVDWTNPDTFHITLIHLPNADDGQLARVMNWVQSVELPDLTLKVGSLNRFDTLGQYALHFRIRQNSALMELQTGAADWLEGQGIPISPYSQPERYIPHITVGYTEDKPPRWTFDSKLSVQPQALQLSFNGEVVLERSWEVGSQRAIAAHDHEHGIRAWELDTPDTLHEKQMAELEQWRKVAWSESQRGSDIRAFTPYWLRGEKAEVIQDALDKATNWDAARVIFNDFRKQYSKRDIQATRLQFEDAFERNIQAALSGERNRRQWGIEMRRIVLRGINAAYRDGLKAGGVDAEPDEVEQESIAEIAANQREYINNLSAKLFKEEAVTPAMADQKAQMWWGNSVQPAYYAGFESAARNQMVEFTGDDGAESCPDCQRLKGQRHRLKDWSRKQLIPQQHGENYECGGWQCQHILTAIEGKARGNW